MELKVFENMKLSYIDNKQINLHISLYRYKSRHDEYTEELDINYNVVFDEEFSDEKRISVDGLGEHNVLQSSTKLPRAGE